MRIVGIIPARYRSSRFPGKPLADILGKPMIRHVYERSEKTPLLDRLVVATDDDRIARVVRGFGGESVSTSPDHSSGTDRLAEASRHMGLADEDIVVNIQGDEPLVSPQMIQILAEAITRSAESDMATLAFGSTNRTDYENPNVVKVVVDSTGRALYFTRSPVPFCRENPGRSVPFLKHLGFYAYRNSFLQTFTGLSPGRLEQTEKLEQLRALEHGYRIQVALSPCDTLSVDTPEDLAEVIEAVRKREMLP